MGVQSFFAIIYLYQQIAKDAEVLLPQFSSFYRDFEEETTTVIEPRDLLDSTDLDAPWQDDPRYIGTEVLEDVVHHDDDGSSSAKASLRGDSKNVKKAASTKKKLEKPKKNKIKSSPQPLVESIDMSSLQNSSPPAKKKVRSVDNKSSLLDSSPPPLEEETSKMVTLSDTQQIKQSSSSSSSWYLNTSPKPYNLHNILNTIDIYGSDIAIVIYDPSDDAFHAHTPKYHSKKRFIENILPKFTDMLRKLFPHTFTKEGGAKHEMALAITSDDFPMIVNVQNNEGLISCMSRNILLHDSHNDNDEEEEATNMSCISSVPPPPERERVPYTDSDIGPILQFGSVFKTPVLPSMIHMPPPSGYLLGCFHHYIMYDRESVCKNYIPMTVSDIMNSKTTGLRDGVVLGDEDQEWDDLIPQVIWRGTDMEYLPHFLGTRSSTLIHRRPNFDVDVEPHVIDEQADDEDVKLIATRAMRNIYNELLPRWQGVVLTAEAHREAEEKQEQEGEEELPWANIKFNRAWDGKAKIDVKDSPLFQKLEEYGIPAGGQSMTIQEVARYKYHIDLGGTGGKFYHFVYHVCT